MADHVAPPPSNTCEECQASPRGAHPTAQYCHGCRKARKARHHQAWYQRRRAPQRAQALLRACRDCGVSIAALHENARTCAACRAARLKRPRSGVSPEQGAQLRALVGHVSYPEIQRRLGLSKGTITRWCWENGIRHKFWNAYPDAVVEAVIAVYEAAPAGQGKQRVQAQFPQVKCRSVIEHHTAHRRSPRQTSWTGAEQIEAAKMAGLVSHTAQARYFGRPNAFAGSIKSLWMKRFQCAPGAINGLWTPLAWELATAGCPAVLVQMRERSMPRATCLWLDLAQHLRPDLPEWIPDAVHALAQFQAWLHGTDDPAQVRQMITEREEGYGDTYPSRDEWPGGRPSAAAGSL